MNNKMIKFTGLVITCAIISACSTDFDNPVGDESYNNGGADFSNFVAIGDSLTAGYADGALYLSGQNNSYPAILAQQFAKVGGGTFNQPLVNDNLGGLVFQGAENPEFGNRLVLNAAPKNPPDDLSPKGPEPIAGTPITEVFSLQTGTFNNMGVPGAKSFHLISTDYGNPANLATATANPYYIRFASETDASMIGDAVAQPPSFFVMWIGNNDVLSYATTGGIGANQLDNTVDAGDYGSNDITNPDVFEDAYDALVAAFTDANPNAKGVLINIPDIATIPYFTTVPFNAVPLDQETADLLNDGYAGYNAILQQRVQASDGGANITQEEADQRTIIFAAGQNAVVILDEDLTDLTGINSELFSMRQATADDLLVLTTSSKIGTLADENNPGSAWGVGVPLQDGDVLIPSEIAAIDTARTAFNATIQAAAEANNDNLILVDVAAIMKELSTTGINYGTGFVNATYATGGGFSLDGVHPTARGYAIISNQIIEEINSGFNANIPTVDPSAYTTIFVK